MPNLNLHLVPKLEGTHNFLDWKTPCIAALEAADVWQFVEGDPAGPVRDEDEKPYLFEERLAKFRTKAKQARTIIILTCTSPIQQTLADISNAKDCWQKLLTSYEASGIIHEMDLWIQFATCA
jgi:hypothetical protein